MIWGRVFDSQGRVLDGFVITSCFTASTASTDSTRKAYVGGLVNVGGLGNLGSDPKGKKTA